MAGGIDKGAREDGQAAIRAAVDLICALNNDARESGTLDPDAGFAEKRLHDAMSYWGRQGMGDG